MRKRVMMTLFVITIFGLINILPSAVLWAKEKTFITFAAGRPGDSWNVLAHGLVGLINKQSDWIEADVVATAGTTDNTRLVVSKKEKRANHIIVTMIPGWRYWGQGEYVPMKIGSLLHLASVCVTLDPNIKNLEDLKGKTITLPRKVPKGYAWIFADLLKQVGVWDSVKAMHGGLGASLTALRDGAAHSGVMMFDFVFPDQFALGSNLEELQTRGTLHFLQQGNIKKNIEMIAKACKSEDFVDLELPTLALVVPPNSLGKTQTKAMAVVSCPLFWAAGKEVSEDIVYEVTKIIYGAAKSGELKNYHAIGRGITPEFLVTSFWENEEECRKKYHPGALKFYDEIGLKLRSFGELHKKYMK